MTCHRKELCALSSFVESRAGRTGTAASSGPGRGRRAETLQISCCQGMGKGVNEVNE